MSEHENQQPSADLSNTVQRNVVEVSSSSGDSSGLSLHSNSTSSNVSSTSDQDHLDLPAFSPVSQASREIKTIYSNEQLMEAVDAVQLSCSYKICGHLSLAEDKRLAVCKRRAGLNTKHEGHGRCFVHDPLGPYVLPSSTYARELAHYSTLQELFETIQSEKAQFKGLEQELAMARTVLAAQLKQLDGSSNRTARNSETYSNILLCLEQIRRLAETTAKVSNLASQSLTLESVQGFLILVQKIIEEEVIDAKTRVRIFDRVATEAIFPI